MFTNLSEGPENTIQVGPAGGYRDWPDRQGTATVTYQSSYPPLAVIQEQKTTVGLPALEQCYGDFC